MLAARHAHRPRCSMLNSRLHGPRLETRGDRPRPVPTAPIAEPNHPICRRAASALTNWRKATDKAAADCTQPQRNPYGYPFKDHAAVGTGASRQAAPLTDGQRFPNAGSREGGVHRPHDRRRFACRDDASVFRLADPSCVGTRQKDGACRVARPAGWANLRLPIADGDRQVCATIGGTRRGRSPLPGGRLADRTISALAAELPAGGAMVERCHSRCAGHGASP